MSAGLTQRGAATGHPAALHALALGSSAPELLLQLRPGLPLTANVMTADANRRLAGDDNCARERAKDPPFTGEVVFQPMAPHCWGPRGAELHQKMVNHIVKHAPKGADVTGWRY